MRSSSPFSFLYSCVQAVLGRAPQSGRHSQAIGLRKWIARAVVLVLLAGSASLFAALHKSAAENGKPDPAPGTAAAATKGKSASASERNSKPGGAPASKSKEEKRSGDPAEAANATNTPAAAPPQQLTPSLVRPEAEENEHEDADLIRRRQEWFYSQRAYPNAKIPAGARQRALEQRDRMMGQPIDNLQPNFLAAPPVGPGALQFGIIPLPGDGTWHLIGPQPNNEPFGGNGGSPVTSGRVNAIAIDPTDLTGKTAYLGGAAGGVWKTIDGGVTWLPKTDTQASLAVGSIAIDPNNHNIVYVGTGEENFNIDAYQGAGVLKSIDGGTTWTQQAAPFVGPFDQFTGAASIGGIAVDPNNSQILLASTAFQFVGPLDGVYRSTNGGATWTIVSGANAPAGAAATSVVFDPVAANKTVYAALGYFFGDAANGIYKSTDEGVTWTKLTAGLPTSTSMGRITLAFAPNTNGSTAVIYAAIADAASVSSNLLGLFKTTNGGASWAQLNNAPAFCNSQCFYDIAIGVDPANSSFVVVGGGGFTNNSSTLFRSNDGGTTWVDITVGSTSVRPHVDTHAIVFAPNGATRRLYIGDDGGVWRTDDPTPAAPLWVELNDTLAITQFYPGFSTHPVDENVSLGGTQDNDTETFTGSLLWNSTGACGDGGYTAIGIPVTTTVYTGCAVGSSSALVLRSQTNGTILNTVLGPTGSFVNADSGISQSDRSQFIPPLAADDNFTPTTLENTGYFGTCRVYQTTDGANSWIPISGDLSAGNGATTCPSGGAGNVTAIDVNHANDNIVLAGTSNGNAWRTANALSGAAAMWANVDHGLLPSRTITSVRTKRDDNTGTILYATFSGFQSGHIFKTINGGTSWSDISGNLPDAPVNDLVVDVQNSGAFDALYIATDVGVFTCTNPDVAIPCGTWTRLGTGLPDAPVIALSLRRQTRNLRAVTHGRSVWNIQLTELPFPTIPSMASLSPASVQAGAANTTVTLQGFAFTSSTKMLINGSQTGVTTTFTDAHNLSVLLDTSLLQTGVVYTVSITDPGGVASGQNVFFVVFNPVPNPNNLTPGNGTVGQPVAFHVTGAGFLNTTDLIFNGIDNTGGVASAGGTVFDITIPGNELRAATTPSTLVPVGFSNPLPGGGLSPLQFGFTISGAGGGAITMNPASLTFASQNVSTTSTTQNVTITNNGTASVTLNAATTKVGANPGDFAVVAPTAGSACNFGTSVLAIGAACNFGVQFTPTASNARAATINVPNNGSPNPQTLGVAGTGVGAATPASITTTSGTPQSAAINTAFAAPLVATVKDAGSNPVSGVLVTFTAPVSGASGTFAGGLNTATTNASGIATSAVFTANSTAGGPYNVAATVAGVATPANFSLTNTTGPAAKVAATSGTPQSAPINTAFAAPLVATVTDAGNNPVSGVVVTFTPPAAGASGTFAGGVNAATTNASGVATSAVFTANATSGGPYNVVASATGATSANFSLTNSVGSPAKVTATSGTPQNAVINTAFAASLLATVTDAGNNPVSGVLVTFTPPASGASGVFAGGVNTATTNGSGVATSAVFTANSTAGPYNVVASAVGATSANFALTNKTGPATKVAATSGTPQNAVINTAFAAPLVATVTDAGNNPVSGVLVTFTPPAAGASGTFAGGVNTATTNASGIATSAVFSANSTAGGPYNVVASATSATSANFALTNKTGPAAKVAATSGTAQNAVINTAFAAPLVATVTDAGNNPVSGVLVTFTPPAAGASGAFAGGVNTATTNGSGVATSAVFTANSTAGPCNVVASAVGATSANFALTNLTGPAAKVAATNGSGQSAAINTAFAAPLGATVTDSGNNPVSGVLVTFTPPAAGASGTFAGGVNTATTNGSGVATSAVFTANSTAGPYNVVASATGATSANFALTNKTGPAAKVAATSGTPQNAVISTAFAAPLVATVTDAGNNPVSGVLVTFTPPAAGASGTFAGGVNTATTNASGVATAPAFSANATAGGPYNVVASTIGATSASFVLTNKPGAAAKVTATSGSGQSAAINTAFAAPLVATVTDSGNNPVSGVVVTFTPPAAGASGTFAGGLNSATTNASGVATSAVITANATASGPYNVVASATGATSANFALTNTAVPPGKVAITSGSGQSVAINAAFAAPLVATVTDAGNNPVSGVVVTFTAPASGASGTFAGGLNTATTNASGVATSAVFTANSIAGTYNVVASSPNDSSTNFTLTNQPGPAAKVTATSGTPQSAPINTAFAALFVATVTDAGNNPVSGVVVTFSPPGSGPSGTFAGGVNTATTNASGVATAALFTANSIAGGPYNVVASAAGPTSANFVLTNTPGPAAKVTATSGTPQNASINTAFAAPLVATVTDAGNNPVSGVVVTFTPPAAGASGTFAGGLNSATTNASGVATSAVFTANATAGGPYNVVASATGATSANFVLTNKAGAAAKVTATSGTPQSAPINTSFAGLLVATVTDAGNNPVSGVLVTFTPPAAGPSGAFLLGVNTATTNASGVATSVQFTANSTAGGPYSVVASAAGAASVNFVLTNTSGTPAKVTATSGSGQSAAINAAFAAPLVATVTDAGNNPVSGVLVTFTPPLAGASGAFAGGVKTATTNGSGVATSAVFTANATAGGPYNVVASAAGATSANFALTNTPGPAAKVAATSGTPQNAVINTAFAAPLVATVTDAGSNPVSGVVVTFTPPAAGASGTFAGGVNTATTNASGVATSVVFSANATADGPYNVVASATGATSANFVLTNKVGAAAKVIATSGTPQSVTINTAFAPFVATVTDAGNNPVGGVLVTFLQPLGGPSGTFAGGLNTATTNASGVATSGVFTANATGGGPYNVVASAIGATSANFVLTNNNAVPTITAPLAPASATASTTSFLLSINGTNFAAGATVTFGSNPPLTPLSITPTKITVSIPAADFATGATINVTVTNPAPGGGTSNASPFTINNPMPTLTSALSGGQNHAPGGAQFTLTVTGTNFVSTSVVSFNNKAETTTFVSATQLTAAIPAADVATAGSVNVTVTNPAPGGSASAPTQFVIDGFTASGPAAPVSVKAGVEADFTITIKPGANGFANPITFAVTGLPAHTTATFVPASVTPGGTQMTTTLKVMTIANGSAPPPPPTRIPPPSRTLPLLALWLTALFACLYGWRFLRNTEHTRRYAVLAPLFLLLVTGGVLAGCSGPVNHNGTPVGTSPLIVTATSGTLSQTTTVTLTVQ